MVWGKGWIPMFTFTPGSGCKVKKAVPGTARGEVEPQAQPPLPEHLQGPATSPASSHSVSYPWACGPPGTSLY